MSYILHCERVAGGTRSPATLQRLPSMSSQGSVEEIFSLQASLDLTPDWKGVLDVQLWISFQPECACKSHVRATTQVDWLWQFEQLRAEGASVPRMHAELEAFCCHHISA
ncbi:unnamed protein product [Sphagnum troendelagicum]|uniref:Uncharacterized protein n=1 Tax=Sphagnum troendelagicum TaxID=128251 RepID=A0ABP0UHA3_9BRYO